MALKGPHLYQQHQRSPLDSVYDVLGNKDLADCVTVAKRVLEETDNFTKFKKEEKSATAALQLCGEAKGKVLKGDFQNALILFNKAIMRAPVNSEVMIWCYFGRAELFLTTKQAWACLKDIDMCSATEEVYLISSLKKMKIEASTLIDNCPTHQYAMPFANQFFTLKGDRNSDIPCATSDVEVIMESGKPKVVAAKDIPVGTVLAVETSIVGAQSPFCKETSCYYCLKMNFNLIPCEGCCDVMFCDKRCEENAMLEGHNVTCKIIDTLLPHIRLPLKATLKIHQQCSSWDEFITASKVLGVDRIKNNTVAEIFGSNKFSLLNSHYDPHFFCGSLFNKCLEVAEVIHNLETQTSFLPSSPEDKIEAIRAVSRIMMHLYLYCNPVLLKIVVKGCIKDEIYLHENTNKGYFPFIGILSNSCLPNSYVLGLHNSAALITIESIQKGAEITYSYVGHWLELAPLETPKLRVFKLFNSNRTVCKNCPICGGRGAEMFRKQPLNYTQEQAVMNFVPKLVSKNLEEIYTAACNILETLHEAPYSEWYYAAFCSLRHCLMNLTFYKFPNLQLMPTTY